MNLTVLRVALMSLWVGVAVAVVSCQNIDSEATKTVYFFDLKTYFETEIKRLESKNIKVNKKATLNGETNDMANLSVDWAKEFAIFVDCDINKPSWKDSYSTDSLVVGLETVTTYAAKGGDKKVKKIMIYKSNTSNRLNKITIAGGTQNLLYSSETELIYVPDILVGVVGRQALFYGKSTTFETEIRF